MHKCVCFDVEDDYTKLCHVCKEALSHLNTDSIRTIWVKENDDVS
jgi:hypothetical protein